MFRTTQRHKLDTVSTLRELRLPSKGRDESVKSLAHEISAMGGEQRQQWNLGGWGQGGLHGGHHAVRFCPESNGEPCMHDSKGWR